MLPKFCVGDSSANHPSQCQKKYINEPSYVIARNSVLTLRKTLRNLRKSYFLIKCKSNALDSQTNQSLFMLLQCLLIFWE